MATILVGETTDITKNQVSFEQRERDLHEEAELQAQAQKRDKSSPFSRWTQFNNEHTKELMKLAIKYPSAHAVLYFLIDQMDNYNAVMCSHAVLEEVLGVSKSTIIRAINTLKDLGFIAVYRSGKANVYAINDTVFWKSWGNNRKYSKFPANIVLAQSEQIDFDELKCDKIKNVSLKSDT